MAIPTDAVEAAKVPPVRPAKKGEKPPVPPPRDPERDRPALAMKEPPPPNPAYLKRYRIKPQPYERLSVSLGGHMTQLSVGQIIGPHTHGIEVVRRVLEDYKIDVEVVD